MLAKCLDDLTHHEAQEAATALPSPEALEAALTSAGDTLNAATLRAELKAANARADVWLRLSDLIGHHEGRVFRRFARELTLDRLLEHANTRLSEPKPRYALERSTGGEVMVQVIDNDMGGQVRGLPKLSGGERFLVSRALALGLP